MIKVKASTKHGQDLLNRADRCCHSSLSDIYGRYSQAKQNAFDRLYTAYLLDPHAKNFGICKVNLFQFACCWETKIGEIEVLRYHTKDNTYLVFLNE